MLNRLEIDKASSTPAAEGGGFELRDAVNFLWRQWKLIGGVVALFVFLCALYLARATPVYTATAQLLLDPRKERAAGQDVFMTDSMLDQMVVENQMMIIKSTALLRRVVEKMQLNRDPEFGGDASADVLGAGSILAPIRAFFSRPTRRLSADDIAANDQSGKDFENISAETRSTIENLKYAMQCDPVARSRGLSSRSRSLLLTLSKQPGWRTPSPMHTSLINSTPVLTLRSALQPGSAIGWRICAGNCANSETAVNRFRSENNLPAAGANNVSLSQEQLANLNQRLVSARAQAAEVKAKVEVLEKIQSQGVSLASLPDSMNAGLLSDLRKQLNDLSRQEADLLARYNGAHPSVINLRAQIADVNRAIRSELQRLSVSLRAELDLAKASQKAVESTLRQVTGENNLDSAKAVTLRELERTMAANKTVFEDFLQRAKLTEEQSTFEVRDSRIITPALPPNSPSFPKKIIFFPAAAALGLSGGSRSRLRCRGAQRRLHDAPPGRGDVGAPSSRLDLQGGDA